MSNVMQDVERFECKECGETHPCRVEVSFENTGTGFIDKQPRFSGMCICDESSPVWERVQNKLTVNICEKGKTQMEGMCSKTELSAIAEELISLGEWIKEYLSGDMKTLPMLWDIEEVGINYKRVVRP